MVYGERGTKKKTEKTLTILVKGLDDNLSFLRGNDLPIFLLSAPLIIMPHNVPVSITMHWSKHPHSTENAILLQLHLHVSVSARKTNRCSIRAESFDTSHVKNKVELACTGETEESRELKKETEALETTGKCTLH